MARRPQRVLLALALGSPLAGVLPVPLLGTAIAPARADYAYGYSKVEQQFIDQGSKRDSILDSTNPIDLMNKLRRGAAMDEATPPKDSIDAALLELEQLSKPQTAASTATTGAPTPLASPTGVMPQPAPQARP